MRVEPPPPCDYIVKPSPDRHDGPRRNKTRSSWAVVNKSRAVLFLPFPRQYPSAPIKLSATNRRNSATILAAVIEYICCSPSKHFQTRLEAALVDTVYTCINMLYCCQFSFLAFTTAFLFEWVFAITSKRQGRSCHIVTNSSSRSSSQKSDIFARDGPHDLLRHMTRPIYMLLSHWPNYLEMFRCVIRLSAPIWWYRLAPMGYNYDRTCSVFTMGHDPTENTWIIVVQVSAPHRLPPTRCLVALRLGPLWWSGLGLRVLLPHPWGSRFRGYSICLKMVFWMIQKMLCSSLR